MWTTAAGLAMYSGRLKLKREWKRTSAGVGGHGSEIGQRRKGHEANDFKFLIEDEVQLGTRIKVVGVGGGGSNAVARMMQEGLGGIDFYVLNTDQQALTASPVANKFAIGKKLTNGLGAGADPSVGQQAALEETEQIIEIWKAPIWCSSPPGWEEALERAPLPWWHRSPRS